MKKILSILIAISLIVSMLPMAFADGETSHVETYEFVFDEGDTATDLAFFRTANNKLDRDYEDYPINGTTYYRDKRYHEDYGTPSRGWRWLDVTDEMELKNTNSKSSLRLVTSGTTFLQWQNLPLGIAFALEAPATSGFYVPEIRYTTSDYSASDTDKVYVSKLIENVAELDVYTAKENQVGRKGEDGQSIFEGAIYSSSGDEVVIAVTNEITQQYRFDYITLTQIITPTMTTTVNGSDAVTLNLTDDDDTNNTATASTTVSGKKKNTTITDMPVSNNFITYNYENLEGTNVVNVDAKTGVITAQNAGKAKVWAETKDYNEQTGTGYKSTPITVTVTATEDEEPEEVPSGVTVVYDISGVMDKMAEGNGGSQGDASFGGKGYWGLDYTASDGFWEYAANRTDGHYSWNSDGINCAYGNDESMRIRRTLYSGRNGLQIKNASNWWAIKINVPVSGIYTPKVTYWYFTNSGDAGMNYFLIKDTGEKIDTILGGNPFTAGRDDFIGAKKSSGYTKAGYAFDEAFDKDKYLEAGEYYLVYKPYITESDAYPVASNFTLDGGDGSVPMINMSISASEIIKGKTAKVSAEVKKMSKPEIDLATKLDDRTQQPYTFADADEDNITIAYSIAEEDEEIASITADGVITGLSEGIATVVATATQDGKVVSTATKKISVVKPMVLDKEITYEEEDHTGGDANVFTFNAFSTDGGELDVEFDESINITLGKETTVSTDDTITVGDVKYNFLYWAKGATMAKKQIVSELAEFDYLPSEGANYLIAVYEPEMEVAGTKVEFYNGNGQLLPNVTLTEGKYLPDYPSMAGYGTAYGWALKNADGTYTEYRAGDDVSELTGNLMFAAMYEDLKADITVFVNGTARTVKYGDTVTCTPDSSKGTLMYWMKDGSVVSLEDTYSFLAWEDCRVEAVYGTIKPELSATKEMRKIILDRFTAGNETAIMAEFIGFDDAVEKGIMFGSQKIAMSSKSSQFTVLDDAETANTAYGYAIIPDGEGYKMLTDGIAHIGVDEEAILNERREIAVDYMREMATVLWTPEEDITYTVGTDRVDTLKVEAGKIYRGVPYAYSSGSLETFMEFVGEPNENRVYTVSDLDGAALSGGQGLARLGNDCSGAVVRAWSKFGANIQAKATSNMTEKNGFIKVGDYDDLGITSYSNECRTTKITEANGKKVMFAAYAELKPADAVVHYLSGYGHVMMISEVDAENQKVKIIDQTKAYAKTWGTDSENTMEIDGVGTVYNFYGEDVEKTFQDLYDDGYLPITCCELVEANYIADEVTFRDTLGEESHNLRNLLRGTIHSTKAIDTVKVEILSGGNVVQSAIASVARANIFAFNMQQFVTDNKAAIRGTGIDTDSLASGTYTCKVTVYLTADKVGTPVRSFTFTK